MEPETQRPLICIECLTFTSFATNYVTAGKEAVEHQLYHLHCSHLQSQAVKVSPAFFQALHEQMVKMEKEEASRRLREGNEMKKEGKKE